MTSRRLSILVGRRIVDADMAPQDGGLMFDGEITLSVYNRYELVDSGHADAQPLVGSIVLGVEEAADKVVILLDNGCHVEIDLTDDAYSGPEAMQLRVPGEPIVIWT